jgi:NADH-quinone oxidoreductase subunit A
MADYVPILLLLILALGLPAAAFAASYFLHPRRYDPVKMGPYECGIVPSSDARERYSIRYYVIAVLFVVFDVETIFLFPWAVQYKVLRLFGFIEMGIFLLILVVGYLYAWRKGALEWA